MERAHPRDKYTLVTEAVLSWDGYSHTVAIFVTAQGCKNAYESWKTTGLSQAIAYRLYKNPDAFPSKGTQDVICKSFNAQPEDFLLCVPYIEED